jgi:hypothetical protein
MTGKAYYLTTLGDWQRHAAGFAVFLRWLYRRIRNDEITRTFVHAIWRRTTHTFINAPKKSPTSRELNALHSRSCVGSPSVTLIVAETSCHTSASVLGRKLCDHSRSESKSSSDEGCCPVMNDDEI